MANKSNSDEFSSAPQKTNTPNFQQVARQMAEEITANLREKTKVEESVEESVDVKVKEKIQLLQAIDRIREAVNRGEDLPKYLLKALQRHDKVFWCDVDRRLIAKKLVSRFSSDERHPITRDNRTGITAITKAAGMLGKSVQTIERWFYEHNDKANPKKKDDVSK